MSPLDHPLGFSGADSLELIAALFLLAAGLAWRPLLEPFARRFAARAIWSMALLAALPLVLRLLLLPSHPAPVPDIYDEFGHLFVADTLSHFRLANPAHPLHRFFETFFILQEPTYSSIYPIGQGLILALGRAIFGTPWAGVILATSAFCALTYWMLRGWTTPGWALTGGVIAIAEFGPLSAWMNNYWGGSLAACAGCLVFGALPRLTAGRLRDRILLGLGLAIHLVTRQFESIFLVAAVALYFAPLLPNRAELPRLARALSLAALVVVPAIAITLVQNRQVTGSWTTLPEALSQYQYGVPASLTFEHEATPHRELTPEQALGYRMQVAFHPGTDTPASYFARLFYRARYYRFFFLPPLYLALVAFLPALREFRYAWAGGTVVLFALGTNFFPAFQLHYVAAVACLFILASVTGLERLSRIKTGGWASGAQAAQVLVWLCCFHFGFWYTLHANDRQALALGARPFETWDGINHGDPHGRRAVAAQLDAQPGRLLVIVRYGPHHIFQQEWVYNPADIDGARIVWARDRGAQDNRNLLEYFRGRTPLLLEPDAQPPRLTPYSDGL